MVMKVQECSQYTNSKAKGHITQSYEELKAAIHSCNSEYEVLLHFLTCE